jgi:hypothetical protein
MTRNSELGHVAMLLQINSDQPASYYLSLHLRPICQAEFGNYHLLKDRVRPLTASVLYC